MSQARSTLTSDFPHNDVEGAEHGGAPVGKEKLSGFSVNVKGELSVAALDDNDVVILIFDPGIALGGSLPAF